MSHTDNCIASCAVHSVSIGTRHCETTVAVNHAHKMCACVCVLQDIFRVEFSRSIKGQVIGIAPDLAGLALAGPLSKQ